MTIGQTIFDRNLSTIEIDGTVQHLSARQSEILALLAQNIGQTVERDTIVTIPFSPYHLKPVRHHPE